jgi:uncharacterized protein YkwD
MTRAALVLLFVAACGSGAKRVGSQPSWRRGDAAQPRPVVAVTFAPATPSATRYNEPLRPPPPSPLGDAMMVALREAAVAAKAPVPAADSRLFLACTELAQVAPEKGTLPYAAIEFALQRHGIIEPAPYLLFMWLDTDSVEQVVEELKPQFAELFADASYARVGIGFAKRKDDGAGAIVFAMQSSSVATQPIPRSVAAGGAFMIDAVIDERFKDPDLFVTRPTGATERISIETGKHGAIKAKVPCGKHIGKQQVEIEASDVAGSTVLANFPVWCGAEPPASITVEPSSDDDAVVNAEEAEKRLLALTNRDRLTAGLHPLLWDDRVVAVARKYSEEMHQTKLVAHISPTSGSAADRTKVAGIKTPLVLENVARAYGVGEAHGALMNSPGHRANLMSAAATHIGIGIVLGKEVAGRREMFLTQVFIRIPPKVEPAQIADVVRQRIDQVRPVVLDAQLQSVAQALAEGLAAGKTRDSLWPSARKKLDQMNTAYAKVGSVISAVADMDALDGKSLVGDYKPDDIGVGIAQGNHPEIGEGAIWVVVLMAERLPPKKPR